MIREYFNSKAGIWDNVIAEKDNAKLLALANRLDINYGSRVLDVGTGTGVFTPFLLDKIGSNGELIALDIAEQMLGQFACKEYSVKVNLVQADISFAPFASDCFDSVVCYSAFPHFQNKLIALTEIYRILKNNGILYICHSSSKESINNIHRSIPHVCNDIIPDLNIMKNLLDSAGFNDNSINDLTDSYFVRASKPR